MAPAGSQPEPVRAPSLELPQRNCEPVASSEQYVTNATIGRLGKTGPSLGCVMTVSRTMVFTKVEPTAEAAVAAGSRAARTGCPWHDVKEMLRQVGLRPTRQRMALGWILFGKGDRHITAEMLYEEATKAKVPVSLATVY